MPNYPSQELPRLTCRVSEEKKKAVRQMCLDRDTTEQKILEQFIDAWLADPETMERAAGKTGGV